MSSFFNVKWSQGFNGGLTHYIDNKTICFKCGRNVKFIKEGDEPQVFHPLMKSFNLFAVHFYNKVFAAAESDTLNPKIKVWDFPFYNEICELEGAAHIEITAMEFSASDYMCTTSGVPDFTITIWNYVKGLKLCSTPMGDFIPSSISFSPTNWRKICMTEGNQLHLWTIQQCDTLFVAKDRVFKMPDKDTESNTVIWENDESRNMTRASTHLTRMNVEVPNTAITGLHSEDYQHFEVARDSVERALCISHAWTPLEDVFIGCVQGQLLKLDVERNQLRMMVNPLDPLEPSDDDAEEVEHLPLAGNLERLVLSKDGIYAAGQDGILRLIICNGEQETSEVKPVHQVKGPVLDLVFNQAFSKLAIGTSSGHLDQLSLSSDKTGAVELITCSSGNFVGVGLIPMGTDICVTIRDSNLLQLWHLEDGKQISELSLPVQCCNLKVSPTAPLAVVGTVDGKLIMIDCSKCNDPRIIHSIRVHDCSINFMSFDPRGQVLITAGNDGNVVILSGKASKKFEVIGYTEISGEVLDISVALEDSANTVQTVVVTNNSKHLLEAANKIYFFELTQQLIRDPTSGYASCKCDFTVDAIRKMDLNFANYGCGCALVANKKQPFFYSMNPVSRKMHTVVLPEEAPKRACRASFTLINNIDSKQDSGHLMPKKTGIRRPSINKSGGKVLTMNKFNPKAVHLLARAISNLDTMNYSPQTDKKLLEDIEAGNKASFLSFEEEFSNLETQDPMCRFDLSPDKSWVVCYGSDGILQLLDLTNKSHPVHAQRVHDVKSGGIIRLVFSGDSLRIITCGRDGSIVCNAISADMHHQRSGKDNLAKARTDLTSLVESEIPALQRFAAVEAASLLPPPEETEPVSPTLTSAIEQADEGNLKASATWVQQQIHKAQVEEDKQYIEVKKEVRQQLIEMKKVIQDMVTLNNTLPELEMLELQEFELDIDEQAKIVAETDSEVGKVREDIEMDNLAKMFIHNVIKQECWDDMKVKGRSILAFNSPIQVKNFPMRARSAEELEELETVVAKRKMELADLRDRKEYTDNIVKLSMPLEKAIREKFNMEGYDSAESGTNEILSDTSQANSEEATEKRAEDAEDVEEEEPKENVSLTGGFENEPKASLYGGVNEYVYSQFDLHTREQKIKQVVLLQDTLYRIKETFNKEFDDVFQKKEQEMARIKDKNQRINKILVDLDLMDQAQPDPEFDTSEKPERLLVVEDSEVTVERFLTADQRKKLEEERLAEEERKRKERADNWRERGLDEMMGGVLEVKKEDELKKDVPKPAFMLTKAFEEFSEDEKKIYAEYDRKVKELNEEREKYKKQLEAELKKLTGFIDDGKAQFDDLLVNLFNKKITVQMAVYQEEVKILRHKWSLLVEEELNQREKELKEMSAVKHTELDAMCERSLVTRKVVDKGQESYDIMCAEDKLQEKNVKKEFSDQSTSIVEMLLKAFRRRPKKNLMSHNPSALQNEASPYNPYAGRPSTARLHNAQKAALEAAITELDSDRRDEVDSEVWERLCRSRRKKIFKEYDIRQRAQDVADMNEFMRTCQENESRLRADIQNLDTLQDTLNDDRHRFYSNLEIQLMLKQGQVEVDVTDNFIHDFTDSLLIHRSVVSDLNSKICALGAAKVQHMMEEKEFKKKFIHIEWELRRMMMEYQDLENKMKDIQGFRISREVQRYLSTQDYDALINSEIQKMEQAIQLLQKHQEQIIGTKSQRLRQISRHKSKRMSDKNDTLVDDLREMNVCVNERIHISEVNAEESSSAPEKRYRQILQRQKLVDLAKAQAKEVAVLRAEVERLRMRTFPALVQNK